MKICDKKNIVLALSLTLSTLLCTYQVALAAPQSSGPILKNPGGPNGVAGEGTSSPLNGSNNGNDANSANGSPSLSNQNGGGASNQNSPPSSNGLNMFESSGQGKFKIKYCAETATTR